MWEPSAQSKKCALCIDLTRLQGTIFEENPLACLMVFVATPHKVSPCILIEFCKPKHVKGSL